MTPKSLNVVGIYRAVILTYELQSTVVADTVIITLGNDDDEDIKFLKKVKYYKPDRYRDVYYNREECLKDFKHRIGVLK